MPDEYKKLQDDMEKRLRYRYGDKERERSNRATGLHDQAMGARRRCTFRHDTIAWSGPPHDVVRAYICLRCNAAASEPEIRDRGFEFETIPDWELGVIFDDDLQRQGGTNPSTFAGMGGIV